MSEYRNCPITPEQRDMILAALRLYQQVYDQTGGDIPGDILAIATNDDAHEAIDLHEIDDICERINV